MRKPKGIIFDLGNTLIERSFYSPMSGFSNIIKYAVSKTKLNLEQIEKVAEETNNLLHETKEKYNVEFNCQEFHRIIFDKLNIIFEISPRELELEYHNYSTRYKTIAGAKELLDYLQSEGVKLGLCSNSIFSREIISDVLKNLDLMKYFSFIISSADYGFRKPHPFIFDMAIRRMDLPLNEIWYVGDSIDTDITGALNANLFTIWFNQDPNRKESMKANAEIRKLQDLIEMISKMNYNNI